MRISRIALLVCFCLCCSWVSVAQSISGITNLDIDPDSGTVTATCETDTDPIAEGYYTAEVVCTVTDSNNNVVAQGGDTESTGTAQVVLTFAGTPGETYTAIDKHEALAVFTLDTEDPSGLIVRGFGDVYNFSSFSEYPQTYDGFFEWDGPGPETQTRNNLITTGDTQNVQIRYYTPGELMALILSAQSLFPPHCDTVFANVVPSYNNNGFFASLEGTSFIQYPPGTPNIPPHGGANAATLVNQPGRPIELFPDFYPTAAGLPAGSREFTLIHEGLHHYTGWYDFPSPGVLDFETQFFSSGYRNTTSTSSDFTVWLTSGCPPAS